NQLSQAPQCWVWCRHVHWLCVLAVCHEYLLLLITVLQLQVYSLLEVEQKNFFDLALCAASHFLSQRILSICVTHHRSRCLPSPSTDGERVTHLSFDELCNRPFSDSIVQLFYRVAQSLPRFVNPPWRGLHAQTNNFVWESEAVTRRGGPQQK